MAGFMEFLARIVAAATVAALLAPATGCRRAGPSLADDHPGIDPKPSGRALSENIPMKDLERPTIDLSRPEPLGRSFDPSSTGDPTYDAAMRGEAWAQTEVGKSYVAATEDDLRVQQGVRLLQQAAEQNDAEALFILGSLAMAGVGIPQSTTAAFEYCRRAAEFDFPDAQYELAAMYALGRGTEVDEQKALHWARKAMDQGNTKAKYSVGRLLLLGEKEADLPEAVALLNQAIDNGIDEAGILLAEAYYSGKHGLTQDTSAAVEILGRLSARGNTRAEEIIARIRDSAE
jgi:TPR repeat protein